MDKVVLVALGSEAKAKAAFDRIHAGRKDAEYTIHDMALVKKEDGQVVMPEGYTVGTDSKDKAVGGGVLGALIGFLAGPVGVLVGAAVGASIGAGVDNLDVDEEDAVLVKAAAVLDEGQTALVALVHEPTPGDFEANFADEDCIILVWDAEEVAEATAKTDHLQNKLAAEAIDELRAASRPDSPQTVG